MLTQLVGTFRISTQVQAFGSPRFALYTMVVLDEVHSDEGLEQSTEWNPLKSTWRIVPLFHLGVRFACPSGVLFGTLKPYGHLGSLVSDAAVCPQRYFTLFLDTYLTVFCASRVNGVIGRDGVRTTIHTAEADASFNYQLNKAGRATVQA